MDHGSEFGAHRVHDDGTWEGDFKQHLEMYGIKPILGRVAHPQTNGNLERFFQEYKRQDTRFLQSTSSSIGITIDRMEAWSLIDLSSGYGIQKKNAA